MNKMNSTLYIYDVKNLNGLKSTLNEYKFFSIAYLFHMCDTLPELSDIIAGAFDKTVIDITNLITDGNYYRIFSERYLYILSENIPDLHFCMNYKVFDKFTERFPYFFEETNTNWDFHDFEGVEEQVEPFATSNLNSNSIIYTYNEISAAKGLHEAGTLISLSDLIDQCEGISFQYNLGKISKILESQQIEYVDLSSIVRMLRLRPDLIFPFEILMHRITSIRKVKYCVEYARISDVDGIFPLCFSEKVPIDSAEDLAETVSEEPTTINIQNITTLATEICEKLRGHDAFKSDFQHNLLKFSFLNGMGERKILSIMLCGDSGIGKTQFAKFVSQVIFPGEPLIKINFGNYSTEGVLNSLIGSPLGYIGSEEGGELINKIDTSKSKVILIDEFEKATPSVYNFFYELLEDGVFTDRHGIAHNLDGYLIIFTSNMTEAMYHEKIPDSLKSRFDMVYHFVGLPAEEKQRYIQNTAIDLIENLEKHFGTKVEIHKIQNELNELCEYDNLRDIKRNVEDIVFNSFLECYKQE